MYILTDGIASRYEYEKLARVFFPDQKMNESEADDPRALRIEVRWRGNSLSSRLKLGDSEFFDQAVAPPDREQDKNYCELTIAQLLCRQLIRLTGFNPPWGLLTGIRPMKLLRMLTREYGKEEAERKAEFLSNLKLPFVAEYGEHKAKQGDIYAVVVHTERFNSNSPFCVKFYTIKKAFGRLCSYECDEHGTITKAHGRGIVGNKYKGYRKTA